MTTDFGSLDADCVTNPAFCNLINTAFFSGFWLKLHQSHIRYLYTLQNVKYDWAGQFLACYSTWPRKMLGVRVLTAKARAVGDAVRADARGWLICGAVLAVTVVRSGVTYSFGMFVVRLHQKFPQLNLAEQSTSVNTSSKLLIPAWTPYSNQIKPKQLADTILAETWRANSIISLSFWTLCLYAKLFFLSYNRVKSKLLLWPVLYVVVCLKLSKTLRSVACPADWIGTLSFCVSLTCAPLSVGFIRSLGSNHGYRVVGLLGTGILAVSCLGSSFVQQPEWLFLTHSLLYGIGSSLVYMTSSLVIGDHFRKDHKYHVLATSILLCGYPLGTRT